MTAERTVHNLPLLVLHTNLYEFIDRTQFCTGFKPTCLNDDNSYGDKGDDDNDNDDDDNDDNDDNGDDDDDGGSYDGGVKMVMMIMMVIIMMV